MASTYSSLKIQLMATGENSGTWGNVTNVNLGTALEEAIVGSADVAFSSGNVTLTLTDSNSSQTARNLRLNLTGTTGGARDLIVPAIEKVYIVNNGCADTITVKNSSGTGIAVPAGKTTYVYNNGTNVVDAITHLTSLTLGTALPIASGGTGTNSTTYANLQSNVTGVLPIANGGTGSNSATFSGANITALNATAISTGTIANARTTATDANGASTIVARDASGNFTANTATLTTVTGAGSGLTALNASNISSGTLAVGRGGTGINAVGTAGNVLTSNGTAWVSQAAAAGFSGATTNAVGSSAITLTNTSDQYQVAQINSAANNIVNLPNATTLSTEGFPIYLIENRSPIGASLLVKDSTGGTVGYISVGQIGLLSLKDNSSAAGTWAITTGSPQTFINWDTASIATNALTGVNFLGITGLSSTLFVRHAWTVTGSSQFTYTFYNQACTISGSTITFGAISSYTVVTDNISILVDNGVRFQSIRLSDTAFAVRTTVSMADSASGFVYYAYSNIRTNTVSGTTITYGTSSNAGLPQLSGDGVNGNRASAILDNGIIARLSDTSYALVYNDAVTSTYARPYNYSGSLSCQIVTVSGTTQTIGTKVTLGTSTYTNPTSIVATSSTRLFVAYGQAASAGSTTGRSKMNVVSVSGTVPTWGTSVDIEAADVSNYLGVYGIVDGAVAPSATQVIFNIGYGVAEGTVSGTTPTYDSLPSGNNNTYPLYLTTSTKAFGVGGRSYLSIATGGFVLTSNAINVIQPSLGITPVIGSPLGAQPTTSFIGYNSASTNTAILGSTT